ncbi:hypothetical protein [Schleiferilactobacillus perolens]|jgi:hypothetical protein|uniref:hypothetical protein n=1 Tax=Schleiferilactobacillus perolens TaxID=100468 RepID=UPI0039ECE2A8
MKLVKVDIWIFIIIQCLFGGVISWLMMIESHYGQTAVVLRDNMRPNPQSVYFLFLILTTYWFRVRLSPLLLVRLHSRQTIYWQNLCWLLCYTITLAVTYWSIVGLFAVGYQLNVLLIDMGVFILNGLLMGTVLFTLIYSFNYRTIVPVVICLILIFIICFTREFASDLANGNNLFIAQSWLKGNFWRKALAIILIILGLNYFSADRATRIELYD